MKQSQALKTLSINPSETLTPGLVRQRYKELMVGCAAGDEQRKASLRQAKDVLEAKLQQDERPPKPAKKKKAKPAKPEFKKSWISENTRLRTRNLFGLLRYTVIIIPILTYFEPYLKLGYSNVADLLREEFFALNSQHIGTHSSHSGSTIYMDPEEGKYQHHAAHSTIDGKHND